MTPLSLLLPDDAAAADPAHPGMEQVELLRSGQSWAGHLHCGAAERGARWRSARPHGARPNGSHPGQLPRAPGRSSPPDLERGQFALYKLWLLHCERDTKGISVPGGKQDGANIEPS